MFRENSAWGIAGIAFGLYSAAWLLVGHLTEKIWGTHSANGNIGDLPEVITVAIAFAAAYIALDRQRLHKRTFDTLARVSLIYDPLAVCLLFREKRNTLDEECMFLVILCYAGHAEAREVAEEACDSLADLPYLRSNNARILKSFLIRRLDRKLLILVLGSLSLWMIGAVFMQLTTAVFAPPPWVISLVFGWVALGFFLPAVSWIISETAFSRLSRDVGRWSSIIAKTRNLQVAQVQGPPPAATAEKAAAV